MTTDHAATRKDPWTLFVAVGFGSFVGVLCANAVPLLIGALADGLNFTEVQGGMLGTIEMAALSVTAILVSPWMARVSRAQVAIVGGLVAACAQFLSMEFQAFDMLVGLRLLVGVALGICFAAATAAVAGARNPDRVYGVAIGCSLLALGLLFYPVLGKAIASYEQRGAYFVLGIIVLIGTASFKWLGTTTTVQRIRATRHVIPVKAVVVLFTVIALFNLGMSSIWSFTERIGTDKGLAPQDLALYLGFTSFVGIGASLLAGWLGPRYGRSVPTAIALLIGGVSALAIANVWNVVTFIIALVLYWIAYMFLYPFLLSIAVALDPGGRVAAAAAGVNQLVFSLGPTLGGFIAASGSYQMIGIFGALACGAGALLALMLDRILDAISQTA